MIVCPECASPAVTGRWIENLKRAEWVCLDCGHAWPVSSEDAGTLKQEQSEAIQSLLRLCERAPWSAFYTGGKDHEST
jgi:transcription initiation factor TFIIIB Brf1 subunit/transcription initiation factor TFIIB